MKKYDIIIVGAGMAGLAAARVLAQAGSRVVVLEARDRVGGRIHTIPAGEETLELGAEFIHGLPEDLWRVVREAGLDTEELEGKHVCWSDGRFEDCREQWEDALDVLEDLKRWQGVDCSFSEYIDRLQIPESQRQRLTSYIEGFNAADAQRIGVASLARQQAAEDAIEGDRIFRIRGGYSQIPEFIADRVRLAGGEIAFNTQVQSIQWRRGQVELTTSTGGEKRQFTAGAALITVPLGVLQQGSIAFSPEPEGILAAAQLAAMGKVRRISLLFTRRFWADSGVSPHMEDLSFLHAMNETPATWWSRFPSRSGCLTGWVGGPKSNTMAAMTGAEIQGKSLDVLARIFRLPADSLDRLLIQCASHEWRSDPWSLGAYSYLPADASAAPERMSPPVESTLYFAGEHTDTTGHWGTVHAALGSGLRAARQILEA
jgi:monoamine oxidase